MSFQIIEILDSQPEYVLAKVSHQNNQVTVIIPNKKLEDIVVGQAFQAEMSYDQILDWKIITDFDDAESGIWQEKDGVHLLGRIHSILDFGDGVTVIEVYMQNGPELFAVSLEAINNETLEDNDGFELTVCNLYLYPNDK